MGYWEVHYSFTDDHFLLVVTGVLSMGQLHNCDVYRITNVQFVSLKSAVSEFIDPRISEVDQKKN